MRNRIKIPLSRWGQRAKVRSRYHLCSPPSREERPHAVPAHGRAVTGAPGARLLGRVAVGVPAPRCIPRRYPSPFHHPGVLFAALRRVLVLFLAVYGNDYIGTIPKCQETAGFFTGKRPCSGPGGLSHSSTVRHRSASRTTVTIWDSVRRVRTGRRSVARSNSGWSTNRNSSPPSPNRTEGDRAIRPWKLIP